MLWRILPQQLPGGRTTFSCPTTSITGKTEKSSTTSQNVFIMTCVADVELGSQLSQNGTISFPHCTTTGCYFSSISHFATADEFTDTTLRILTAEKRQYGQYYCRAANKLGSDQASVELFGMAMSFYICLLYRIVV